MYYNEIVLSLNEKMESKMENIIAEFTLFTGGTCTEKFDNPFEFDSYFSDNKHLFSGFKIIESVKVKEIS